MNNAHGRGPAAGGGARDDREFAFPFGAGLGCKRAKKRSGFVGDCINTQKKTLTLSEIGAKPQPHGCPLPLRSCVKSHTHTRHRRTDGSTQSGAATGIEPRGTLPLSLVTSLPTTRDSGENVESNGHAPLVAQSRFFGSVLSFFTSWKSLLPSPSLSAAIGLVPHVLTSSPSLSPSPSLSRFVGSEP